MNPRQRHDRMRAIEARMTLTAGIDYSWDTSGLVVSDTVSWSAFFNGLLVGYTHGYDTDDWRMDGIRAVCIAAAARLALNPGIQASETSGSESWTAGNGQGATLTAEEREALAPYALDPL